MTTLNRAIKWYINGDLPGGRNAMLDGLTANPPQLKPALMQGDTLPLQLYFRQPGLVGADTTALTLAAGYTLYLVGKLASEIDSGAALFAISTWTSPGEGQEYYAGTLNLNTEAIAAAFAASGAGDTLDIAVDIEYRDAGNTERCTYRADVQLFRQVYQGAEVLPTPSATYPFVSPSGYVFEQTIDDNGQLSIRRIS
jgi:hypothetical protein